MEDTRFWKRLLSFVENVQVNDMASEEEKDYIIRTAQKNINTISLVNRMNLYLPAKGVNETITVKNETNNVLFIHGQGKEIILKPNEEISI